MAQTYTLLKDRIETKLNNVSKIQEVWDEPRLRFDGYPAAVIIPSNQESDYETTSENERVYPFQVSLLQDIQATDRDSGIGTALDILYDLVDDVLDEFDKDPNLSNDGALGLASGYTLITVDPVFAGWSQTEDEDLIQVDITIRIRISVDITNI